MKQRADSTFEFSLRVELRSEISLSLRRVQIHENKSFVSIVVKRTSNRRFLAQKIDVTFVRDNPIIFNDELVFVLIMIQPPSNKSSQIDGAFRFSALLNENPEFSRLRCQSIFYANPCSLLKSEIYCQTSLD